MKIKVVSITSAHPRYDTRIFHKICKSLSKKFDVSLIVADGKGDTVKDDIKIFDVGTSKGRLDRVLNSVKKIFKEAVELNADIYHLHDPELIPVGLKLKEKGKKVIFDSHEDIPKQIMGKHYLNTPGKKCLSFLYGIYEKKYMGKFDFVISATPFIRDKFISYGIKSIDINNYPLLYEFSDIQHKSKNNICYIGLLYETRGIREIVKALEQVNTTLIIAGKFFNKEFKREIMSLQGWKNTDYRGFVGREEIKEIISSSIAGLVTLHPTPSYIESLPVKMFEYMGGGIPVIASDFEYWKKIIDKEKCGICVNPYKPDEIAQAMEYFIHNPDEAKLMGENGRKAVFQKYNWSNEEKKLLQLYENIL